MAMEEAQTRSRIQAVDAAREEGTTNTGLAQIVEALERLNDKIEKKVATLAEEVFFDFHNTCKNHTEDNCTTKKSMINDTCYVCHKLGHSSYIIGCPVNKNPRPPPPAG